MTWRAAMDRYGSDKPDIRFGMELVELTPLFAATEFRAFQASCVKGILVPGEGGLGRGRLDALTDQAKAFGAKGLVWLKVGDGLEVTSPVAKFLSEDELRGVIGALGAEVGDLCLLVADEWRTVVEVLRPPPQRAGPPAGERGRGSTSCGSPSSRSSRAWPRTARRFRRTHPFTMPHVDDVDALASAEGAALLDLRSQAYDLTLNGWELGSGSVRIHRSEVQRLVFERLGIDADEAQQRFGFLLDAFPVRGPAPCRLRPSASTGWQPSWPARRTSARSSPSRRASRVLIR